MQRDDAQLVADVAEAGRRIAEYVSGLSRAEFDESPVTQDAVIRQLEIIGEASRRLSMEFKGCAPYDSLDRDRRQRNLLIHAYHDVDLEVVWNAATVDVPSLIAKLDA